jgi:transposase-like protein
VKIRSYTVDFKVRAVETLRNDPDHNISAVAKSFSIDRKRLREWEKSYDKILEAHFGKGKKSRKLHPGAEVISLELDVAVFEYLEEERSEGRIVRNKDLKAKALVIAQGLGLGAFKASSNWLWRWKRRWDVGMRRSTNCSQRVPADYQEQLAHFRRTIVRYREVNSYALSNIVNMYQTMVRLDSAPKSTNNIRSM